MRRKVTEICGAEIMQIRCQKQSPLALKKLLDAIIVAPCTGNTLAKLANSITDTTATLAVKKRIYEIKDLLS